MRNNEHPVALETTAPEKENEQSPRDITDAIKKIKDTISGLPGLWIDKSATVASVLYNLFECESRKQRFKHIGFKSFFESMISFDAAEYIYAIDSAVSLLAPNSIAQKVTSTARNVALLDSMVDLIADKVSVSDSFNASYDIKKILKDCKDCHIRPRDFDCDSFDDVDLISIFMAAFVGRQVGEVFELKSPKFATYQMNLKNDTIHCKLVYLSIPLEMDEYGIYYRDALRNSAVIIAEIKEFDSYVLIAPRGAADRNDITIRRLCTGGMKVYLLHHIAKDDDDIAWVRYLPFATIDMRTKYLNVFNNGSIYAAERSVFNELCKKAIFDKRTEALIERISSSGKTRCSRSYALVGIPGTGKSFIMNKLAADDIESAIIMPIIGEEGLTYEMQRMLNRIMRSLPQEHIYILLDDFDKCIGSKEDRGQINQKLIEFFSSIHLSCPGGKNEHTFTLIATMNNPKLLNNAIIKRSERFDEVIEIGLPQPEVYGKRLNSLKVEGDQTDYTAKKFGLLYRYMRHKVITLADLGNIYNILRIHRAKNSDTFTFSIRDLLYAVRFIGKNRSSASKEYEI